MNISSASIFSDDFHNWLKSLMREIISESLQEFRGQQENPYCSQIADPEKVYSRKQVAEILGRSESTITKYIRQRKLVASNYNGVYYISGSNILKFLNQKNGKN